MVVGLPLTNQPFDLIRHDDLVVPVETSAEIIAEKMWHRGDQAKARDLFDLCAVAALEPEAIDAALPFMHRHGRAFLEGLDARGDLARIEFEQIDALAYRASFAECMKSAAQIIEQALSRPPSVPKPAGRRPRE